MFESVRQHPLFENFTGSPAGRLERSCRVRDYAPDQAVVTQGRPCEALYFVLDGRVRVTRCSRDGAEHVIGFPGPGEVFCLCSLFSGAGHLTGARACGEAMLARLSAAEFLACLKTDRQLLWQVTGALGEVTRVLLDHFDQVGACNAEQKLAAWLLGRGGADPAPVIRQTDIASYLQLAPETLSRAVKRLREDGLVTVSRGKITVADPQGLSRRLG